MSQEQKILIVDDAEDNRLLLKMLLEDDYEILEADSGNACLELVKEVVPTLVLLDVNMPGMTGYDVCVELRKNPFTEAVPVIFVSALDSAEERLAGFEAGADDYLTKPVDGDELLKKVEYRIARQSEISAAKKEASSAMSVAMEAMTSSSELGLIIQFVKKVQDVNTVKELGESIITAASEFSLNACALMTGQDKLYIGCEADSLEAKLLEKFLLSAERITNWGIRTIIQSDNVVLLIKNMPLDDESRYGRLKDHLAVLVDIAHGRTSTLLAEEKMVAQREKLLKEIISLAEKEIKQTSSKISDYSASVTKTMESMLDELESMLFGLGLEDDQEKKLVELADQTSVKLNESSKLTGDLDSELGKILDALYSLLEK